MLEIAASYGPKSALVLDKPAQKPASSPRLVMTSAEQCGDLDQETARICASSRVLRLQGEDHGKARREAGRRSLVLEADAAGIDIGAEEI